MKIQSLMIAIALLISSTNSWALLVTKTISCPSLTASNGQLQSTLPAYLTPYMVTNPLPSTMTSIPAVNASLISNKVWCQYNAHVKLVSDTIGTGKLINCSNPVQSGSSYKVTCTTTISTGTKTTTTTLIQ